MGYFLTQFLVFVTICTLGIVVDFCRLALSSNTKIVSFDSGNLIKRCQMFKWWVVCYDHLIGLLRPRLVGEITLIFRLLCVTPPSRGPAIFTHHLLILKTIKRSPEAGLIIKDLL